jgi:hypothetical protein
MAPSSKKKISSTSSQADKYEALIQPFKDPDDVEKLLEQVVDPNVEDECKFYFLFLFDVSRMRTVQMLFIHLLCCCFYRLES